MYEKRTASIQKLKVCVIIQCTLWPLKYNSMLFQPSWNNATLEL